MVTGPSNSPENTFRTEDGLIGQVSLGPTMDIEIVWDEEHEESEPGHRYISHFYGLHPSDQISVREMPMLAEKRSNTG
ncbi:MAG: hypothetical protein U5K69_15110 [Balneolaceae bacterium]|nr:hypothetical protein [Balneolaceae bacterium]